MTTMSRTAPGTPRDQARLLLGADVGGTRSRVTVAAADGTVLARATGAGFNRNSSGATGLDALVDCVADALAQAQAHLQRAPGAASPPEAPPGMPGRVIAVLGIAGAGPAHHHEVQGTVRGALTARLGELLAHEDIHVHDDLVTAFAAGSADGDGLLLLAGTGAVAARYRGFREQARCDGMGWLLGDVGSAVWIGREVLQAAAADLDSRGPSTALTAAVTDLLEVDAAAEARRIDPRQALIAAVHRLAPAQWGSAAPLAELAAEQGDEVAAGILDRAADALISTVDAVRTEDDRTIVVAGSVIEHNQVIAARVHAALTERGLQILPADPPVEGALRLAAKH